MQKTDFLIIGAGIIGLSIVRELSQRFPGSRITIVEKEKEVAFHASGRNSGVLHAGFYYDSSSLKAKFTVRGNAAMTAYCLENGLPINQCGKVVVASDATELAGLHELKRRGDKNKVVLEYLDEKQLAEIEPNARTFGKALFSPTTSSVNPRQVCRHIVSRFPAEVSILFDRTFCGSRNRTADTGTEKIEYGYLFNAAGLYADKVARHFNRGLKYTMLPFKGIYLACKDHDLIQRHIYPVPNLKNPFLGVHFTKTVDHHVKIGPTAIPALWRENYDFRQRFRLDELVNIMAFQSRLFAFNHFNFRNLAFEEVRKYHRNYFINESTKLVKRLDPKNFGSYLSPGIRAQLLDKRTSRLVMDFIVEHAKHSTHVLNSVSPAFTTAFTFAEFIVDESEKNMASG